jgi:4-amino-4-deoxy-L-arabinose transferase-like glycosyltransferase
MPRWIAPRWRLASLLAAALLMYLIGDQHTELWDRDEPRYAQCSRQMLQTGNWIVPMYLDHWRTAKPPLIYWCQASAMEILGDTRFAARLPSALAVLCATGLLAFTVWRGIGSQRAIWSAFIFSTSAVSIAAAKFCLTDAVMMLFVLIGQICLLILWRTQNRKAPWWAAPLLWISVALAGLTKGPQTVGMHLMTLLVLAALEVGARWRNAAAWRDAIAWWKRTNPLIGVPLLIVIVCPWLALIHERAPGFLSQLLNAARAHAESGTEGHGGYPGTYLLQILGTFYPWSLLLPAAIGLAARHRRLWPIRFALAATIGPWLLMEMVKTKLPFYILPIFPSLSFLTADALVRGLRRSVADFSNAPFRAGVVLWAILTIALGASPWIFVHYFTALPLAAMAAFSIVALALAAAATTSFFAGRLATAAVTMGVGIMALAVVLYGWLLPTFTPLRISDEASGDLRAAGADGPDQRVIMIDYKEPSLAFDQGGGAREADDGYLGYTPPWKWADFIVSTESSWNAEPAQGRSHYHTIGQHPGLMYAGGARVVTVLVLQKN